MPHLIPSIYNVSDFTTTTVADIALLIRSDKYLPIISKIRDCKQKKDRDKLKKGLPAFTLGDFHLRIDNEGFQSTRYIIYDIDNLATKTELYNLRTKIEEFCLFQFVSPSGNGIKFIIEMDSELDVLTYRANRDYYRTYLSDLLGATLDKSYGSWHTFISYDPGCKVNFTARKFPALDLGQVDVVRNVDVETLNVADTDEQKSEIRDVCEFIAEKANPLNYHEWMTVAMSLKPLGDYGKELFLMIGKNDTSPDHSHRNWRLKWDSVGTPREITLASLFWVAVKHGYKRKQSLCAPGLGMKLPFLVKEDGMYVAKKKGFNRVFGFKSIEILYTINDPSRGSRIKLRLDNDIVEVPQRVLATVSSFRQWMMEQKTGFTYMSMTDNNAYDMLMNYLDRTQHRMRVDYLAGSGRVARNIWNLGNCIIYNDSILPFDEIIYTSDEHGYLLDDISDEVQIQTSKLLYAKLEQMFEFYDNWAAIAIGWAFSNIYYSEILFKCGGFPLLFIHGRTRSGKSQLAYTILSMFGVMHPETSHIYKVNMENASESGMSRIKDKACGIPTLFDEYGSKTKDVKKHEAHFQKLKSLFDASGKTTAKFTNDNQVKKTRISSGTMLTACYKEEQEEAVNRCVYVNMDGMSDKHDAKRFETEMQGRGREVLSGFILASILNSSFDEWQKEYDIAYASIERVDVGSRVHANFAIVMAGYEVFRRIIGKRANLPEIPHKWWINQAQETRQFISDVDPLTVFLTYLKRMVQDSGLYKWMFVEPQKEVMIRDGVEIEVQPIWIHISSAKIDIEKNYRVVLPNKQEISSRLKESPYHLEYRLKSIGGMTHGCYKIWLPEDESIIEQDLSNDDSEVPF